MKLEHVDGENKGNIILFALSTCGWCKKTRMLIEDLGVEYDYIYVDLTNGDEREEAVETLKQYNPDISFPTLVINDSDTIIGFEEDRIKSKLS
ncbi:MAG: glutaredoxin family protein [Methanobrevibacter arboriphilus]|jgi:glutaredoxin|uniref:NrdH-redoxin n=2 Tax=Methanobrevibacter arboriphilus TaxID=39441 RepID=A0ACA8R2X6_METAZ|nr:glutaredoxin family protein [Methanobrevibacter arboriphilus]MBF4469595.1 glutaredoxin family protein [Methanobrevibacter arboriphilus]MCC7562346.1 glutaredoxin family protein [Methanobrevibacter arboriphilus]BBL61917.1 NrdH-redoxin [Methanobrevibacter arboriphilus]GLI11029.1 NrdH-redoxin [Methanobrevibacter arboriphilus]